MYFDSAVGHLGPDPVACTKVSARGRDHIPNGRAYDGRAGTALRPGRHRRLARPIYNVSEK